MSIRRVVRSGLLALATALMAIACGSERVNVDDLPSECSSPGTLCAVGLRGIGDGGPMLRASFAKPRGWARDAAGNIFLSDGYGNRIRRIDAETGIVTTVAGNGRQALPLRPGLRATETEIYQPTTVAVCPDGAVLWADWYGTNQIWGVDPENGTLQLVAGLLGGGGSVSSVDRLSATFNFIGGSTLTCDDRGLLWIGDSGNHVIRVLNRTDADVVVAGLTIQPRRVVTVAGVDNVLGLGTDGTAWQRRMNDPQAAIPRADGSFFVVESGYGRLLYVDANGYKTQAAGGYGAWGVAIDEQKHVFSTEMDLRVRVLNLGTAAFTFAGVVANPGEKVVVANSLGVRAFPYADGAPALQQGFDWEEAGPILDDDGNLLILDTHNAVIRRIDREGATMSVVAGWAGGDSIDDFAIKPSGLAIGADGSLLMTGDNSYLWRVDRGSGRKTPIAGNGAPARAGDGGDALSAGFFGGELAVAPDGTIYVADTFNRVLRAILPDGSIRTIAGDGGYIDGGAGDGGLAVAAVLDAPYAVAVDSSGAIVFLLDDNEIRAINRTDLPVTVAGVTILPSAIDRIAGQNAPGFGGDLGVATLATLNPTSAQGGLHADGRTLYLADTNNHRIRAIDLDTGIIRTVAGNGAAAFSGDGGVATLAAVGAPTDVFAANGRVWWIQQYGGAVRTMVAGTASIVMSVGGGTGNGVYGDGGDAIRGQLAFPYVLTVDDDGVVWLADHSHRVWRIQP